MLTEFVPLSTTVDNPELQVVIFIFLFLAYVLSVMQKPNHHHPHLTDCHLKTPMYYFLRNFSFLEITFTSVSIPGFWGQSLLKSRLFPYNNCLAQLFFFIFMGVSEFFLHCHVLWSVCCHLQTSPLHHHHEQENLHFAWLVFSSWLEGFLPFPHHSCLSFSWISVLPT